MQHIGIDARLTYYRTGGISTYIRRLITALEELDHEHQYTVFHSRKARKTIVERFSAAPLWTPAHHRVERMALTVELARFGLDLLHSPDFIPPLHGARRHIITVHDLTFLRYPDYVTAGSRLYYNDQIAWAVRHADHILVDSDATRHDLIDMLHVPDAKMTLSSLGVDPEFRPLTPDERARWRAQLDLPGDYILFVGTFEPRKNIGGLLSAYAALLKRLPETTPPLVLAGTRGWLFEETMAEISRMNLGTRVIWRESVPQEAMPALYNLARALVLPSFYEGFGLPVLEAMACGTVPIVSNRSSLPEVAGDVGLQIDPDNLDTLVAALEHALTDDGWLSAQQELAVAQAAKFTWQHTAEVTLATYQSLL
ncbi:MAG: glycosyltransferase family 4 protein [Anaerolineae bacterium]|nr:glycosyltransferase family 4 protein [Anaerolineae bacterium]